MKKIILGGPGKGKSRDYVRPAINTHNGQGPVIYVNAKDDNEYLGLDLDLVKIEDLEALTDFQKLEVLISVDEPEYDERLESLRNLIYRNWDNKGALIIFDETINSISSFLEEILWRQHSPEESMEASMIITAMSINQMQTALPFLITKKNLILDGWDVIDLND